MNSHTKQHVFSVSNVEKYFISPYVKTELRENGIFVYNDNSDMGLLLKGNTELLGRLLDNLVEGITQEELINYLSIELSEENPFDWLQSCIQGGIIE